MPFVTDWSAIVTSAVDQKERAGSVVKTARAAEQDRRWRATRRIGTDGKRNDSMTFTPMWTECHHRSAFRFRSKQLPVNSVPLASLTHTVSAHSYFLKKKGRILMIGPLIESRGPRLRPSAVQLCEPCRRLIGP